MTTFIAKILEDGRVTIPKPFRDKEGLEKGIYIELEFLRKINKTKEA